MSVTSAGSPTVLLVEDDARVRQMLRAALEPHDFDVQEATSVAAALAVLRRGMAPAVVLLDLGLPDGDGLDLLHAVRGAGDRVPVIVLSARGKERDKVVALDAGADDYLTKPFGADELLARIRVARRHAGADDAVLEVGPIRIDQPRHEVTVNGAAVHLTPIEFRLLVELARLPGRVLTHHQLVRAVWGSGPVDQSHTLRVHVAALRRKLEVDPAKPRWLLTEAGVGYRLRG